MAGYLKGYGNVLLQGYYFDKPLLAEEFEKKYCGPETEGQEGETP